MHVLDGAYDTWRSSLYDYCQPGLEAVQNLNGLIHELNSGHDNGARLGLTLDQNRRPIM